MSSFRKNKKKTLCIHCSSPIYNNLKCKQCKLWYMNTPKNRINKKDLLFNINEIYVINMKNDRYRLVSFFNNLKKNNISTKRRNWNRFNAVNGNKIENINSVMNELIENEKDKEKIISLWKKYPGSIGCYFSHMKLWNHIYNDINSSEYTLILEDDSFITPNGLINIELSLIQSLKFDWDLLYAGHNLLKGTKIHPLFLKPTPPINGKNDIGFNSGFFGYILKKSSIPKLLNNVKKFDSPFIDVQIRNSFSYMNENINALFITSNLIRHNNSYSSTRKKIDNLI